MKAREESREVALPAGLVSRIEDRVPRTRFEDADEYVAFVLEETLARVEARDEDDAPEVDEGEVRARLESLGYLE